MSSVTGLESSPPAAPPGGVADVAQGGIYRGWSMVLLGFLTIAFASSAAAVTLPLIYGPVMHEFGWTRTEATLIFTYKQMASSLLALFIVGPMIDRWGLRVVVAFLCTCTALGMTAFLWVDSLWSYYLAGFLFGMGGTTLIIPVKVLVSRWFNRSQGLAVGLMMLGMSVGGVIFPLVGTLMIAEFGWRAAFASLSLGIWFVALPLYLLKSKDQPTEADLLREAGRSPDPEAAARLRSADLDMDSRGLLRDTMFWFIAVGLLFVGMIDAGMMQHTILYMQEEAHLSPSLAAITLSGTFAIGVAAKVVSGKVYDWWSIRGIQVWYLMLAVSILLVFFVSDLTTAILFTIFRGIAHGGLVSETAVVAKHCYGPRLLNRTLPLMTGFYGVGAALGPLVLSVIHDRFGSYEYGFGLFFCLSVAAAILLIWVKPIYRERLARLG